MSWREPTPSALVEKIIFAGANPPEYAARGSDADLLGSGAFPRGEIGIKGPAADVYRTDVPAKVRWDIRG